MEPLLYQQLQYYLQTLEYPTGLSDQEEANLKKQIPLYYQNQELIYKKNTHQRLLTNSQAKEAFHMYHSHPLGGHLAFQNTLNKIKQHYYWPKMKDDVRLWVSTCPRCQAKGKEALHEQLHPVQVPIQPFQQIAMDIKYMPMSRAGHAYIIVAIDYFSKWVECQALQTTTSIDIFNFFVENIITRHSVPKIIITDNGSPFQSHHIALMCQSFHIKHYFSTVYHPQTNGLVERFNRTLGTCLHTIPEEEKNDWHLYLSSVRYSYNTAKQDTTKYSPFQLLYGYHPNMPIQNNLTPHHRPVHDDDRIVFEEMQAKLVQIRNRATLNIQKAQERQRRYIEKRILDLGKEHKPPFKTGDLVLKLSSRAEVTPVATIDDKYQGPYVITQTYDNRTYALKSLNPKLQHENRVHGNKLKIYKTPNIAYNPQLFIPTQTHYELL